jgi:hypothetical protein
LTRKRRIFCVVGLISANDKASEPVSEILERKGEEKGRGILDGEMTSF